MTHRPILVSLALAFAAAGGAFAQDRDARAQYERDRQFCRSDQSTQDVQACLREAAAAYAEYRRDPDWAEAHDDMTDAPMRAARADRG
jgi:hypothetical protein